MKNAFRAASRSFSRLERFHGKLVVFLGFAVAALLGSYVYFLASSVWSVVVREHLEERIAEVHSALAALEADYLAKQHAVSVEASAARGLAPASRKTFVAKRPFSSGASLSLLRNEI